MSPAVSAPSAMQRMADIRARFEPAPVTSPATDPSGFAAALGSLESAQGGPLLTSMPGMAGAAGSPAGEAVVANSMKYLGIPYRWGGTDPDTGLDCSGFVQRAFRDMGVELPRVSRDQATRGTPVASIEQARPGDLIAFGSPVDHIGIYVGDNKMIHAPRTGEVIKVSTITRTPTAIRRVIPDAGPTLSPTGGATAASFLSAVSNATMTGGFNGSVGYGASALGGTASTIVAATPALAPYAAMFQSAGERHGISPAVLAAVAKVESGGNPAAVSRSGAQGLMQFMPGTARGMGIDALDPAQAIDGAARLLKSNRDQFGSLELALAAYNAGGGAVRRAGGIPPYAETQAYVRKVMSLLGGVR